MSENIPQFLKPRAKGHVSQKKSLFGHSEHYSKLQLTEEAISPAPNLTINIPQLNSPLGDARTSKLFPSTTRASVLMKSPTNEKRFSKKEIQPVKTKSLVPFTDQIPFARYMLYFPQDEVIDQTRKVQTPKSGSGTLAFKKLVDQGSARMEETQSKELFSLFTTGNTLRKQLDYNKEQENLFRKTAEDKFFRTQTALSELRKEKDAKNKLMPKIRINPSLRFQDQQKQFEDEVVIKDQDDDDKPKVKYPKYMRYIKYGANDKYNFHWYQIPENDFCSWRPNVTESASFVIIGKHGYLYGGRSKEVNNELAVLDITTWQWSQAITPIDPPPFGRFGHTANAYKKNMILFGGVKHWNTSLNFRECLNDVRFYATNKNEWSYIKCHGDLVEPRRNHSSVVVGKHLVVYGGINSMGEYLYDLKALDLVSYKWITCKEADREETGLAFHKACVVLYEQRREVNLFKLTDFKPDDNVPIIKEEGIYFFGGRHYDDTISNTLKILKIGQSILKWITPKTLGKPPEARFLHTMTHCKSLNMLVVYGGRNDNMYSRGESPVFGDFYTFQLETLTWVGVSKFGATGQPRFAHVATIAGTSLIIFGGINYNVYAPADINLIEMDQMAVNKLLKGQDRTRKSLNAMQDEIPGNPLDKYKTPEMKLEDNENDKYVGMKTFMPLPNHFKREKAKSKSIKPLNNYFNSARTSRKSIASEIF